MKFVFLQKNVCLLVVLLLASASDLSAHNGVLLSVKMQLNGALSTDLMRDDLRAKGLLPSTEPYTGLVNFKHFGEGGGEAISSPAVFETTGDNAIVDWVVVELRNANAITTAVSTRSALLQRDGDVVDMDGISPVHFLTVAPGQYHVIVRHRNHLGVMTAEAMSLTNIPATIDFTDLALPLYGTNPCADIGTSRSLWLGDVNRDKRVTVQGPGNDFLSIFTHVIYAPDNTSSNLNFISLGYSNADLNMDGKTIYVGPYNDRFSLFSQIATNCPNLNCYLEEQIP